MPPNSSVTPPLPAGRLVAELIRLAPFDARTIAMLGGLPAELAEALARTPLPAW